LERKRPRRVCPWSIDDNFQRQSPAVTNMATCLTILKSVFYSVLNSVDKS
jgi:hypothetical protein